MMPMHPDPRGLPTINSINLNMQYMGTKTIFIHDKT